MTTFSLKNIIIKEHILEDTKYDYLFSVDTLNDLVLSGVPFRDAYKQMGEAIENGSFVPKRTIKHTHIGSIGNLCLNDIKLKWTILRMMMRKNRIKYPLYNSVVSVFLLLKISRT